MTAAARRSGPRVPFRVRPMLATLVDAAFHLPGWVYEEKYDGIRLVAYKEGSRVTLLTRNLKDRTDSFPEIARAVAALPAGTLALDGEAVSLDDDDISRFQLLQGGASGREAFAVFDCLFARGHDLRQRPLLDRRDVVTAEVRRQPSLLIANRLGPHGLTAFAEAQRRGLEGIVAKDEGSPYLDGRRSPAWRKVKVRAEDDFVVGGFTAPAGARIHLGALLIGVYDHAKLRYAGKVGSGFTGRSLAALRARFSRLVRADSPFVDFRRLRGATWLEPRLVAKVAFTERTTDGRLRHPVFLGLRDDREVEEVRAPRAPRQTV